MLSEALRARLLRFLLRRRRPLLERELLRLHADAFVREHQDALAEALFRLCPRYAPDPDARPAYSQEGEDVLLARLLYGRGPGFFVDVGAHHPTRYSNTYALYKAGWRGINIDAAPGSMVAFARLRPEDVNIECAVSGVQGIRTFHVFAEPALNTFDAALAAAYARQGYALTARVPLACRSLRSILDEHAPPGRAVDLMNLDVEGEELNVLRSNDWERYAPEWILMEVLDAPFARLRESPAVAFLLERGYAPVSRLAQTVILRRAGTPGAGE